MDGGTYAVDANFNNFVGDQWTANSFQLSGSATLTVNAMIVPAVLPKAHPFTILTTQAANSITGDFANSQNILITGTNTKWQAGVDPNHQNYVISTP